MARFLVILWCIYTVLVSFGLARAWRVSRTIADLVGRCDGRVCSTCLHDLRRIGDKGRCPECGQGFDVAELQLRYQDRLPGGAVRPMTLWLVLSVAAFLLTSIGGILWMIVL